MLKRLAVLAAALAVSSAAVAHADSISGFFSATGTDSFTSSTLTFAPGTLVDSQETYWKAFTLRYLFDGRQPNRICYGCHTLCAREQYATLNPTLLLNHRGRGNLRLHGKGTFSADFVTNGTEGCLLTGNTCLTMHGNGNLYGNGDGGPTRRRQPSSNLLLNM